MPGFSSSSVTPSRIRPPSDPEETSGALLRRPSEGENVVLPGLPAKAIDTICAKCKIERSILPLKRF